MSGFFKNILSAFVLISFCSCTSIGEVNLSENVKLEGTGKALLKTDSENKHRILVLLDQRTFITSLDNKSLYRMGTTTNYPEALLIDPGEHTVSVQYLHNTGTVRNVYANAQFKFLAKAENSYIIRKEILRDIVRFWIEDIATVQPTGNPVVTQ